MSAEEDLSLEAKAREWLEMAQTKWRLQTMQHRSRFNPKTGEYRQLPTRVRRFLNGTPVSMKARVLSILKESAPYSCPVFDLETGDMKYVPTNTFIRKDGPDLTSGGSDATYTIVQDLKLLDEAGDTFGMRDESSCAQVGEAEWHWDEPDVIDCPDGSQGVSYQVASVSRDRETDLFSYVVRKVQALTVHVPPVVSSCTERSRVTVETWDNVYGEPGAFRWDPVRGRSASLDVPGACDRSDGTLVRVSVSRNADCTYRVAVERVEAVTGVGMYYSQHDRYKSEFGERTLNAFAPLPKQGLEYDHGLVTRYQSERNEDGTWTNDVGRTLERPVTESTVEERRTPRGTTRTRVDTNVLSPAAGIATEFGSWRSVKTPGGLYTNEYVEHVRRIVDDLGLVCTDTAFLKTHESQGTAGSVPSSAHVPPAKGGLVTTWSYDTDAEGLVTKRVRTEQEHTVENAVRRRMWGWLGNTSGYTHRSVSSAVASSLLASGDAGTSVEVRMTNGGLFDVDVQTFLRIAGLRLGFECQKTVYQHVHETAESAAEIGEEAQDAGNGRTYRRSFSLDTSTGAITKREAVTTELEVPESRRTVRVTARGSTVRTVTANSSSKPADASEPGQTTEFEVTPGGRFNVTVEEKTTPNPDGLGEDCSKDLFSHVHSTAATRSGKADDDVQDTTDGSGEYLDRRQRLGDDGLWEVTDVRHTEKPVQKQRTEVRVTKAGRIKRTTDVQVDETGQDPEAKIADIGKERVVEKTRGGKRNIVTVEVTPIREQTQESCSQDAFHHTHVKTSGVDSNTLDGGDVPEAKDGEYVEKDLVLNELGVWEERETTHREIPQQPKTSNYQDAFGTRTVQLFANDEDRFDEKDFDAETLIKSVEQEMTRGKKYSARVTEEKPTEVDSGWLHFDKTTDKGLAVYYDFIVFRNAKMTQVKSWISHIKRISYSGGTGSYANHPSISVSPNRFRLWDGAISLTTTFTPKSWAAGGNTTDDNWEKADIKIKSVNFVPLSQSKLLKIVTTETHKRGGGVGRDKMEAVLAGGAMIKGSQFSYHPSGQAFAYDIITAVETKAKVIDLKPAGDTIWDGSDNL